jgi:hypothetical protein
MLVGGLKPTLDNERGSAKGVLSYAGIVEFDRLADEARCVRCAHVIGSASVDFKLGCLVDEVSVEEAGPVRGEEYGSEAILRRFYCPGCATQLETEVTVRDAPRSSFVLGPAQERSV